MSPNPGRASFPIVRGDTIESLGLTKREWFAGMAGDGESLRLLDALGADVTAKNLARAKVNIADALLAELEKGKE